MNKRAVFYSLIVLQIAFLLFMIGSNAHILKTGTKVLLETVPVDPHDIFRGEYARLGYKISTVELPESSSLKEGSIVYVSLIKGNKFWTVGNVSLEKHPANAASGVMIVGRIRNIRSSIMINLGEFSDASDSGWIKENPAALSQIESIEEWRHRTKYREGEKLFIPFAQSRDGEWRAHWHDTEYSADAARKNLARRKGKCVIVSAIVLSIRNEKTATVEYGIESYYVPEGKARELERLRPPSVLSVEACIDKYGNSAIKRLLINDLPVGY